MDGAEVLVDVGGQAVPNLAGAVVVRVVVVCGVMVWWRRGQDGLNIGCMRRLVVTKAGGFNLGVPWGPQLEHG